MRLSIRQRVALSLLLILGLIIVLVSTTSSSVVAYRANTLALANEALPISRAISLFQSRAIVITSETFRFLIINDQASLDAVNQAVADTRRFYVRLEQLEADDDDLQAIENAMEETIALSNRLVVQEQGGQQINLNAAAQLLASNRIQLAEVIDQYVAIEQAETQAIEAATATNPLTITRILGAVALVVCLGLLWLLQRTVIMPLAELRAATRAVAGGDLNRRIEVRRHDEIGDLADAFNTMVRRVQSEQAELTRQVIVAEQARAQAEAAQQQVAQQLTTIADQRAMIREMTVPVLPIGPNTLVMPLVGDLDTDRLRLAQEQALRRIEETRARHLILDITGVPIIDTHVALGLLQIVRAGRLLGADILIVGVRPEVAQAMVGLGLTLGGVQVYTTLEAGVAATVRR